MIEPIIREGRVFRGSPCAILDVLTLLDGQLAETTDIASFDLRVYDESAPDDPALMRTLESGTTDLTGLLEDTPRTDLGWTQPGAWNWRYVVPGSETKLMRGGRRYRFEFKFNTQADIDGPLFLVYSIEIVPVLTDALPPE